MQSNCSILNNSLKVGLSQGLQNCLACLNPIVNPSGVLVITSVAQCVSFSDEETREHDIGSLLFLSFIWKGD